MPNAPSSAARYTPDAKIIAILRDPVDQLQSHYWHQRRQNFAQSQAIKPAPDIFEALERFPNLIREPALYGKHIQRWQARFPADRMLLLDYAEVTRDLPAVLDRVWAFLDLAPAPIADRADSPSRHGRRGVAPRSGLLGRMYPEIYSAVAHGPYQTMKRAFGVKRVEALKRQLKLREAAEAVFFTNGYPKLGLTERGRLRALFADDLALLEDCGFAPAARWRNAP